MTIYIHISENMLVHSVRLLGLLKQAAKNLGVLRSLSAASRLDLDSWAFACTAVVRAPNKATKCSSKLLPNAA